MKEKIVLLFILIFLLSWCVKINAPNDNDDAEGPIPLKEIQYVEGDWDWGETMFNYFPEGGCITDKETALKIASALIEDQKLSYSPYEILYDKASDIWVVSFALSTEHPSAGISIAINGKNAEVIKMGFSG